MKLYMPTKVYNEKGCVRQHSQELAALGTKALLVTGFFPCKRFPAGREGCAEPRASALCGF